MSDYLQRNELSPVDRAVTRPPTSVPAIQATAAQSGAAQQQRDDPGGSGQSGGNSSQGDLAGIAEYAKIQAHIADILSDLRSGTGSLTVDGAQDAVQSMLPAPVVLMPLPPASREAIEQTARIAKRLVMQASYAHAAQANVARGTAEQVLASQGQSS